MFELKIETDNAAFEGDVERVVEITRLMNLVSLRLSDGEIEGKLRDINGNTVGSYTYTP